MVRPSRDAVARRRRRWKRLEARLRRGPFAPGAFAGSQLHDRRTAALLGVVLGVVFTLNFVTGWLSHLIQHPPRWSWWTWPARPAGLYRVTQGLHVASGIAIIPVLLAKLFVVYPKLWTWPPVRGPLHAVERLALLPLVGGSLLLLATGVANISGWYPWPFFFIQGHYAAAWVTMGALVVHVGAKWADARAGLWADRRRPDHPERPARDGELTRRGLLAGTFGTAGLLAAVTAGQTFPPLRALALLAPRDPDVGSQGLPVNRTAARAGVAELARSSGYRLRIRGDVASPVSLTREELVAMPLRRAELPIACVEGWSASALWRGVPVRDLLALAGVPEGREIEIVVRSVEPRGPYTSSLLEGPHVRDPDTLLAVEVNGEVLNLDHGFPARLIAPNRPGVMQTKWVGELDVRAVA